MAISVDGASVAKLGPGEHSITKVSTGSHTVAVGQGSFADEPICPNLTMSQTVDVKDSQINLRAGIGSNYQLFFARTN